jgi:ADP-ribose pyrophosphatase YjhB (NUDIX family)
MRAACQREIREETGLEISVGPIVAVAERMLEGFHYVIVDFLATLRDPASQTVRPAGDASDARWVSLHEIDHLELVGGLARVLRTAALVRDGLPNRGLVDPDEAGRDYLAL